MKTLKIGLLLLIISAALLPADEIPGEILRFYSDWNTAALCSTLQEREALMKNTGSKTRRCRIGKEALERIGGSIADKMLPPSKESGKAFVPSDFLEILSGSSTVSGFTAVVGMRGISPHLQRLNIEFFPEKPVLFQNIIENIHVWKLISRHVVLIG